MISWACDALSKKNQFFIFCRIPPCNTTTEMFSSNFGTESSNQPKEHEEQIDYRQYDDENGKG
jgi:hypothetical protein